MVQVQLFFYCVRSLCTNTHTKNYMISFSTLSPSSATRMFLLGHLCCVTPSPSIWIEMTKFSVASCQTVTRGHRGQCLLKARETENDPDCKNNWQLTLTHLLHPEIGCTDVLLSWLELDLNNSRSVLIFLDSKCCFQKLGVNDEVKGDETGISIFRWDVYIIASAFCAFLANQHFLSVWRIFWQWMVER